MGETKGKRTEENIRRDMYVLGISGGVSFFTYLPTTPSLIVRKSLFLRESMLNVDSRWKMSNRREQNQKCRGDEKINLTRTRHIVVKKKNMPKSAIAFYYTMTLFCNRT